MSGRNKRRQTGRPLETFGLRPRPSLAFEFVLNITGSQIQSDGITGYDVQLTPFCKAFRIAADGVHLGQEDYPPKRARQLLGPEALIGLTCNDAQQLERALQLPIDYIGLGPCHYTETKQRLAPILGYEGYGRLQLHDYPLPVYAIGGIEPQEEPELRALGLDGIAMSRSLLRSAGEGTTPLPHTPTRP